MNLYELDLENKRLRRVITAETEMLRNALYALGRGKLEVVTDHLERVLENLNKEAFSRN